MPLNLLNRLGTPPVPVGCVPDAINLTELLGGPLDWSNPTEAVGRVVKEAAAFVSGQYEVYGVTPRPTWGFWIPVAGDPAQLVLKVALDHNAPFEYQLCVHHAGSALAESLWGYALRITKVLQSGPPPMTGEQLVCGVDFVPEPAIAAVPGRFYLYVPRRFRVAPHLLDFVVRQ